MSRPKKMIQIEEEGSEEMDNESEDDTPRARRLTLNEFDWFEFENRARKLMGEMLEPIYQRQTDSRNDIKEIRKTLDSHKKRMDEQDFLMHKQAKRIDGVERIWEKLNTMVGSPLIITAGARTQERRNEDRLRPRLAQAGVPRHQAPGGPARSSLPRLGK